MAVDLDHPYAIDLERIFAAYQALARQAAALLPAQVKALAVGRFGILEDEAFHVHQLAIAARDWDGVEYTANQLDAIRRQNRTQVAALLERTSSHVRVYQEMGKGGGRPRANREKLCRDYDRFIVIGNPRAMVIARLAREHEMTKAVVNRILRAAGRGSAKKCTASKKIALKAWV
jgi:hypothetical protein